MRIEYNSRENWEKRVECECRSVFVAERNDIKYNGDCHSEIYYVACPICNDWNYLDSDQLDYYIKDEAKNAWQQEQDEYNSSY